MKNTLIMDTMQGCIYSNQIVSEQNEEDILSIRVENASANPKLDIYLGNEYAETIDMELSEDATATLDIPKKYYQKGNMLKVRFKDDNAIYKFMHFIHDAKIGKGLRVEKIVNTVFQVKFDEELDRLGYLALTYDIHEIGYIMEDKTLGIKPFLNNKEVYGISSSYPEITKISTFPYDVYIDWGDGNNEKFTITDYGQIQKIRHDYPRIDSYVVEGSEISMEDPYLITIKVKFDGITSMGNMFSGIGGAYSGACMLVKVEGELTGCENVENFKGLFSGQSHLTDISTDLFANCNYAKILEQAFSNTGMETIPKGLLKYCNNVIYAWGLFYYNKKLKNVPVDLFSTFVNCKDLGYVFASCDLLETYPITLFDSLNNITNIYGAFEDCINLKGNVRDLVKLFPNASTGRVYYNCGDVTLVER